MTETIPSDIGERLAGKYLTFALGSESYGIPVLKVKEIIQMTDTITTVPQMPHYVRGVINLRGKVITVVDLKKLFQLGEAATGDRSCIIVVQVALSEDSETLMGLIVDTVEEVLNIAGNEIEETPSFGLDINTDYLFGMAKIRSTIKGLLNIDKIISSEALKLITQPGATT